MELNEKLEMVEKDIFFSLGMLISDYIMFRDDTSSKVKDLEISGERNLTERYKDNKYLKDIEFTGADYVITMDALDAYYEECYRHPMPSTFVPEWLNELHVLVTPSMWTNGFTFDMKVDNLGRVDGSIYMSYTNNHPGMLTGTVMHELTHLYAQYIKWCANTLTSVGHQQRR